MEAGYGRRVRCPACSNVDDKVVDSRLAEDGGAIRRRRECLGCGRRFTTYERLEELAARGRQALRAAPTIRPGQGRGRGAGRGQEPARPAPPWRPWRAEVEEALRLDGPEVTTEQVGRAVLERLRTLDEVAYVRFASVYKGFADAGDFEREVGLLTSHRPKRRLTGPKHRRSRRSRP